MINIFNVQTCSPDTTVARRMHDATGVKVETHILRVFLLFSKIEHVLG